MSYWDNIINQNSQTNAGGTTTPPKAFSPVPSTTPPISQSGGYWDRIMAKNDTMPATFSISSTPASPPQKQGYWDPTLLPPVSNTTAQSTPQTNLGNNDHAYKDAANYLFNPKGTVSYPKIPYTTPQEQKQMGDLTGPRIFTGPAKGIVDLFSSIVEGVPNVAIRLYEAQKVLHDVNVPQSIKERKPVLKGEMTPTTLPFNPERIGLQSPDQKTIPPLGTVTMKRLAELDQERPNTPNLNLIQSFGENIVPVIINAFIAGDVATLATQKLLAYTASSPVLGLSSQSIKNLPPQDALNEVANRFFDQSQKIIAKNTVDGVLNNTGKQQLMTLITETKRLGTAFANDNIPNLRGVGKLFDELAIRLNQDVVNLSIPTGLTKPIFARADQTLPGYAPEPAPVGGLSVQPSEPVGFGKETADSVKNRITSSEAFDVQGSIKNGEIARADVYKSGDILNPRFAQGRIDDMAQKLDMYKKGLGQQFRSMVDVNNVSMKGNNPEELVQKALKLLDEVSGTKAYTETGPLTTKILTQLEGKSSVSKQFISDLTNGENLKQNERDVIRNVLAQYPGVSTIPVKEFADKVKAELLPLTTTPNYAVANTDTETQNALGQYEHITLPEEDRGPVKDYYEKIYQSPVKTSAGTTHFNNGIDTPQNYFGHTRIEELPGGIRRVIEVQSDLYQKGNLEKEAGSLGFNPEEYMKSQLELDQFVDAEQKAKFIKDYEKKIALYKKEVGALRQYNDPTAHFRMVREEVRQAAIDGKTKLQFPTGETAMKIEGLGRQDTWHIVGKNIGLLEVKDLKVGLEVKQGGYFNSGKWIITDILGDGKFKAMPKEHFDSFAKSKGVSNLSGQDLISYAEQHGTPNFWRSKETFDISGKVDTNNPVYRFYEKDLARYLKNQYGAHLVTDGKGVTWWQVDVKSEHKGAVPAFKEKSQTKSEESLQPNTEGIKVIEQYKKRLNATFDSKLLDTILTKEGELAYGVTYDNTIGLAKDHTKYTPHHEVSELISRNVEKFPIFKGITSQDLLTEARAKWGKELSDTDAFHKIAEGYEKYEQLRDAKKSIPFTGKLRDFFARLYNAIRNIFKLSKEGRSKIQEYYKRLGTGKGKVSVELKSTGKFPKLKDFVEKNPAAFKKAREFKIDNERGREILKNNPEEVYEVMGKYPKFNSVDDARQFIGDVRDTVFHMKSMDGQPFHITKITDEHLFNQARDPADYIRRARLLSAGIEIAENNPIMSAIDKPSDGFTYFEFLGTDKKNFPNKIIKATISEGGDGKVFFSVRDFSSENQVKLPVSGGSVPSQKEGSLITQSPKGERQQRTYSDFQKPATKLDKASISDTTIPVKPIENIIGGTGADRLSTEKGLAERKKVEARQNLLESLKIKLPTTLEQKATELAIRKEELDLNPLKKLIPIMARRGEFKGHLPEVTGGANKGKGARFGDVLIKEATGIEDTNVARAKFDTYMEKRRQFEKDMAAFQKDKKTFLQQARGERNQIIENQKVGRSIERTERHVSEILGNKAKREERLLKLKTKEAETQANLKVLEELRAKYSAQVDQAHLSAAQKKTFIGKFKSYLSPIGQTDAVTKKIYLDWESSKIKAKEDANKAYEKYAGHPQGEMPDIIDYQAGSNTPWIRNVFDDLFDRAKKAGLDLHYRDNYIPQVYRETSAQINEAITRYMKDHGVDQAIIDGYKKTGDIPEAIAVKLKINPTFQRIRTFPDYKTAMKYGLTPRFRTVAEHIAYYEEELGKTVANRKLIADLIKEGKVLNGADAPKDWIEVKLPGRNFRQYYADRNLAEALNGQFRDEENLTAIQTVLKYGAAISRTMQEITLSAGIPGTNINFFSIGQAIKMLTTGIGEAVTGKLAGASTSVKAAYAFIRSNFNKASIRFFKENQKYIDLMAERNISLANRIGDYAVNHKTWKQILTRQSVRDFTNALKSGGRSVKDIRSFSDAGEAFKNIIDSRAVGIPKDIFDKLFNEKTFTSFMPQMQVQVFKDIFDRAVSDGLGEQEAADFAAGVVRSEFGLINSLGRTKTTQDAFGSIFFAPKFRESIINVFAEGAKSYSTQFRNAAYGRARSFVVGMIVTFLAYNYLNQKLNGGDNMWDNESGREFALKVPLPGGKIVYVEFMPSVLSFVRNMGSSIIGFAKGDNKTGLQKAGTLFSMPLKAATEIISNKDFFGRPIYDITDTPFQKAKKAMAYIGLGFTHPYFKEFLKYFQGTQDIYQTLSIASELPLKFSTQEKAAMSDYYQAKQDKTELNARQRKDISGIVNTYDQIQKLKADGNLTQAEATVNDLSTAEYDKYKAVMKYEEIQALRKNKQTAQAKDLLNALTQDEYLQYNAIKSIRSGEKIKASTQKKVDAKTQPQFYNGQQVDNKSFIETIATYANAIGSDPVTAFKRIFTGQKIRRVDNGAIIVERMSLVESLGVKRSQGYKAGDELILDHTTPLELGGDNSVDNLKLIPKDVWASYTPIENHLGKLLRAQKITKEEAQKLINSFKSGNMPADDILKL